MPALFQKANALYLSIHIHAHLLETKVQFLSSMVLPIRQFMMIPHR
jgi:hypothetical protein